MLAVPLAASADDAGAARPLRTLTFEVDVRVGAQGDAPGDASLSAARGRAVATTAGERHLTAKGSIGVGVVATTADARLVLDIAETAIQRTRPKVRVAVASDGALFYDPKDASNLTQEELALARWLARGFYGDHPTDPGTAWTVDQSTNGYVDLEHDRVVARDAQRVTLNYTEEQKLSGAAASSARAAARSSTTPRAPSRCA